MTILAINFASGLGFAGGLVLNLPDGGEYQPVYDRDDPMSGILVCEDHFCDDSGSYPEYLEAKGNWEIYIYREETDVEIINI